MPSRDWFALAAMCLGVAGISWGQPKTGVRTFDVASIRVAPPDARSVARAADYSPVLPGGQFRDSCIHVLVLIGFAYDTKQEDEVTGLPGWASENGPCYSVAAKAGEDYSATTPEDNLAQVKLMMRGLLEDRFRLQIQPETQHRNGLQLEVTNAGLKISEVAAPIPPARAGHVFANARKNGGGRIVGEKATMAGLAQCLTLGLGQVVVDHTGLQGYYNFDLTWVGDGENTPASFGTQDFIAGAISALRREVGLVVRKTTVPTKVWRITHIERPTEN